jgi:nicotinamidase-related amidase
MSYPQSPESTALILIGYQNDYFVPDGALYPVVQAAVPRLLANTLVVLERLRDTPVTIISTPILFTPDYQELVDPIGILKIIKDKNAFRADRPGGEIIAEIKSFGDRIIEVPGKRGLNAFSNTHLHEVLNEKDITDVVLMGVVTSLCIESTGREAFEKGYHVTILSDVTAGKSDFEQQYYCDEIFPMYANVTDYKTLLERLFPS